MDIFLESQKMTVVLVVRCSWEENKQTSVMSRIVRFVFKIIIVPNASLDISHLIKTALKLVLNVIMPTVQSAKTTWVTVRHAFMDTPFTSHSKYVNFQRYKTANQSWMVVAKRVMMDTKLQLILLAKQIVK